MYSYGYLIQNFLGRIGRYFSRQHGVLLKWYGGLFSIEFFRGPIPRKGRMTTPSPYSC